MAELGIAEAPSVPRSVDDLPRPLSAPELVTPLHRAPDQSLTA